MKTVFKIFIKGVLLSIITLMLIIYFSFVFSVDDKSIKTQFNSIPENTLDVVVLGSSHTQYGINPAVIHNESQLYTYINASACQPVEASYQMLKETLKTQIPKVVILDVFTLLPAKSVCHANSIYKMAADEMTGMEKVNTLLYIDDKKVALDYIFSIRMYHQRWNEIKKEDFQINFNSLSYDSFGYIDLPSKDINFRYLPEVKRSKHITLSENSIKYLSLINNLCKENNIELLLIKTPFDIDQENFDTLMGVWEFAEKENINYIDFIALQKELDFAFGIDSETWHNTNWGAYKLSKYLADYLKENYHFNHKENHEIEVNLKSLKDSTLFSLLNNMPDPYTFLKFTSEFDNTVIIQYKGSNKTSIKKAENELLQSLGTPFDFIKNKNKNYFAIIKNQKLLIDDNKEVKEVVDGNVIKVDKEKITFNDISLNDTEGELTIVVYGKDFSWHHTMNINYASKWFWKVGCDGYNCK